MGAIVGCELLQRFHALPVDNVVFEAAACSVANFKTNVIPFLEEQNLRAQLAPPEENDRANIVKTDRKSTRLNSSHVSESRMPSSA